MSMLRRDENQSRRRHPYLSGNFAPQQKTLPLTPCHSTGSIPVDLAGGQYVRNGGNPITNENLGRDAHWFDGDGMLSGVLFRRSSSGIIEPSFVNQYILTDVYLSATSTPSLRTPLLPSIATLVSPVASLVAIVLRIFRTMLLVALSFLYGSKQAVKKISVANTSIIYHDGRALATCESGPPMRVQLPELSTVGWYDGQRAEGEAGPSSSLDGPVLGGEGLTSFMKEWTTGHPKVDPITGELILFHCTFVAPYVHYSVIPGRRFGSSKKMGPAGLFNAPVPNVSGGKMMHDFGVSRAHTVIIDLPLSLDPFNLIINQPVLAYDRSKPSRFGVFPRHDPSQVAWFETSACCIFHTTNTWETSNCNGEQTVNLLACRLTSAAMVFSAANLSVPLHSRNPDSVKPKPISFFAKYDDECGNCDSPYEDAPTMETRPLRLTEKMRERVTQAELQDLDDDDEQCRLYLYSFALPSRGHTSKSEIVRQYALSAVPFEFPTLNPAYEMSEARYVYGCSTTESSFGVALGKASKVDVLVKMDVKILMQHGEEYPPRTVTGCVDKRSISRVLADQEQAKEGPITCFTMPKGWFAQEARFVARQSSAEEDDGYLLFYAFDESQLDEQGQCLPDAISELWIVNARNMRDVVARVQLPQRVPYGLHGNWFSENMIHDQKEVEAFRKAVCLVNGGNWVQRFKGLVISLLR